MLFQKPRDLGVQSPDLDTALPDELVCPPVTVKEVHDAIFSAAALKAPGPSGSPNLSLRWAWEVAEHELFLLMAECAYTGYHPHVWMDGWKSIYIPHDKLPYTELSAV